MHVSAFFSIGLGALAVGAGTSPAWAQGQRPQGSWAEVDSAMGRPGALLPDSVQKYGFPRADLRVTVDGIQLKPALALGSWVAFKRTGAQAVAMGDLVLLQDEVTPVLTKLQAMGVQVTALHNHLQHESPPVMYLHILAEGDPVRIAEAVHAALSLTKTPVSPPPDKTATEPFGLDTSRLSAALGRSGKVNGGVYQVNVPRAEPVLLNGMAIPPAMGLATGLNFQPIGEGKAVSTGDFVLTADEVGAVAKTLHDGGIVVTALHSHMLGEQPRLFFMHYWAREDALRMAQTLRAALGRTKVRAAA